jgi:hypothetical protein
MVAMAAAGSAAAQESPRHAQGEFPAGHVALESAPGGYYFVAAPLKERYDDLVARANDLRERVLRGAIGEAEARNELAQLQAEIDKTLDEIEQEKFLITPAAVHTREESFTFELGPNRTLCIAAGRVRVVGWNEPHVKCVLEKTVVCLPDESPDEHFDGIRLVHFYDRADDYVGKTREQMTADAMEGKLELSDFARSIIDQNAAYLAPFAAVQGKPLDLVKIDGLLGSEGNRQITIELTGPDGENLSSQWIRHGQLTVYVPACRAVAVRGGREGLVVESVQADLAVVGDGDRDYAARLSVKNLAGGIVARNVWLHEVSGVSGDVVLEQTQFDGNSGTRHFAASRQSYAGAAEDMTFTGVAGDLRVRTVKARLQIDSIGGSVDVTNDFGDTTLAIGELASGARLRLRSEAGNIVIRSGQAAGATIALTECGTVQCVGPHPGLGERTVSTTSLADLAQRNWKGFVSESIGFQELIDVLQHIPGDPRGPGILVISRAGIVSLE